MTDWFVDWFNSDIYLSLYKHRNDNDARALTDLICGEVEVHKNPTALDLACGAGRHSLLFAKKGFTVTGIDLSENLLAKAKERAVSNNANIEFIQSDLRTLKLNRTFDVTLSLFTSFGYFESRSANFVLLGIAYNHTKPGGYFVLDFFNPEFLKQNLIPNSEHIVDGYEIVQKRSIVNDRVVKKIVVSSGTKTWQFSESVQMFSAAELTAGLESVGFQVQKVFGGYGGERFSESFSERILIISKRI